MKHHVTSVPSQPRLAGRVSPLETASGPCLIAAHDTPSTSTDACKYQEDNEASFFDLIVAHSLTTTMRAHNVAQLTGALLAANALANEATFKVRNHAPAPLTLGLQC